MCVVLIGVIVYVFLYAVYKLFVYPYYLCEFLEMPGPPNSPGWRGWIMGNVPQIADSPPVVPLIKWREQYGDFVQYRFFFNESPISLSDPVAIRSVLIDNAGWIMGNVPQIADSPPVVPLIKWREQYGANVSRFDNYRRPVRVDRFLKNILGEGLLTVWGLICFNELASCNEFKQHMHRPLLL